MPTVDSDLERLWSEFHEAVNMSSPELRDWLAAGSQEVRDDLLELGHRVQRILSKRRTDVTSEDTEVMQTVVDRITNLLTLATPETRQDPVWRHSLMSLGHDPLKPGSPGE